MQRWKRTFSILMAGMISLQLNGIMALAETQTQKEMTSVAEVTEVEIGSDVWATPVIPDAAKILAGVEQSEISLN